MLGNNRLSSRSMIYLRKPNRIEEMADVIRDCLIEG